jgi:beta-glucosidase
VSGTCAAFPPGGVFAAYNDGTDTAAAAALASTVDVAVVVVAITSAEGTDRTNLSLPCWQDALVAAVAAANNNTVVVVRCPGACLMPWLPSVRAVLYTGMPGQEAGNALANVLFGAANPSGKLPLTFPNNMSDTWITSEQQYPGVMGPGGFLEVNYTEGLEMGYRWYDAQGTDPLFPFGHGLSYSNFSYTALAVAGSVSANANATVTFTLTNAGGVAGADVPQLYVGFPAAAGEPPKLLRGFQKTYLAPGASSTVSWTLTALQLSIWDVVPDDWVLTPGTYTIFVGASSRDIRLTGSLTATA